jgi:hypothetical protein
MREERGVTPSFVVAPTGPTRVLGPKSIVTRFQIIKTIAWQHSRFGSIAAYARSIPVLDKKNASVSVPRRKLAPMLGEGDPLSGLTGQDSIPHKIAMTGKLAVHSVVDRGSIRASARAPHASND